MGERLPMDYKFTRTVSVEYKKRKGVSRAFKLRQGYTATLIIVDRKTRKLFEFPTAGKSPPIKIREAFLERYKLKDGRTRFIRTDQDG